MNRTILALALLLAGAAAASAAIAPYEVRPLAAVNAPSDAVTAGGSGAAVVLVDVLKSKVTYTYPGGPCGTPRDSGFASSALDSGSGTRSRSDSEPINADRLLVIAGGFVAVGVALVVVGFWHSRRVKY
jgi:hypothetical protein